MSLAVVQTRTLLGIEALQVSVEVHLSSGLPGFAIVGLPETAVRESKERVRSAIINSGLEFPTKRITVNLAPADLPKQGCSFDLAIALGILLSSKQLPEQALEGWEVFGELSLDGQLREVTWTLPFLRAANRAARRALMADPAHKNVLKLFGNDCVFARSLRDAVTVLVAEQAGEGRRSPAAPVSCHDAEGKARPQSATAAGQPLAQQAVESAEPEPDQLEADPIKGQLLAKKAIELAAFGGHSLLLVGPPGCGKTLLINRLHSLLPPLALGEAEELALIRAAAGEKQLLDPQLCRPMRAPHHSASCPALVGGGTNLRPGEASLAHHGLLFLDELAQFKPATLDSLREALETGRVNVARANYRSELPARFQLVAAMNPCPCGHHGNPQRQCRCDSNRLERYQARLSGPLLDRFDMVLELPALSQSELLAEPECQWNPGALRDRVRRGRAMQTEHRGSLNALLAMGSLARFCYLSPALQLRLARNMESLRLSARATHRVIRLARSVADMAGSEMIEKGHLSTAISLRRASLVAR